MMTFPEMVEIEAHGKRLTLKITPINAVIYTVQHVTSSMKNEDGMTFGYLVYQRGFIYAYAILPTGDEASDLGPEMDRKYDYQVIFSAYIGPEDEVSTDYQLIEQVIGTIARVYVQHEFYKNYHPSIRDSERFSQIYKALKADIDNHGFEYVTPYLTPIRQTAIELRDFYTKLVEDLNSLP